MLASAPSHSSEFPPDEPSSDTLDIPKHEDDFSDLLLILADDLEEKGRQLQALQLERNALRLKVRVLHSQLLKALQTQKASVETARQTFLIAAAIFIGGTGVGAAATAAAWHYSGN